MPVHTDYLSIEFQQRDMLVPVDATNPELGTVSVRFREIPFAVRQSVNFRFLQASDLLHEAHKTISKVVDGGALEVGEIDRLGEAFGVLRNAQLEIVRWSVCGHNPDDFLVAKNPTPFESSDEVVAGVRYQIASPKMLRLYQLVSGANISNVRTCLLANMSDVAYAFQSGKVLTPQEIWDSAK